MPRDYSDAMRMSEDHGNPAMRPSIDKLISKLRTLSPLQNHPEAVAYVIHDMMHWYFVRHTPHPKYLVQLMMQAEHLWELVLLGGDGDREMNMIENMKQMYLNDMEDYEWKPPSMKDMIRGVIINEKELEAANAKNAREADDEPE